MSHQPQEAFIQLSQEVHSLFDQMHKLLSIGGNQDPDCLEAALTQVTQKIKTFRKNLKTSPIAQGINACLSEECHQMMLETMSLYRKNEKALLARKQSLGPLQEAPSFTKTRAAYLTA